MTRLMGWVRTLSGLQHLRGSTSHSSATRKRAKCSATRIPMLPTPTKATSARTPMHAGSRDESGGRPAVLLRPGSRHSRNCRNLFIVFLRQVAVTGFEHDWPLAGGAPGGDSAAKSEFQPVSCSEAQSSNDPVIYLIVFFGQPLLRRADSFRYLDPGCATDSHYATRRLDH